LAIRKVFIHQWMSAAVATDSTGVNQIACPPLGSIDTFNREFASTDCSSMRT
jgi:hypothetical protein